MRSISLLLLPAMVLALIALPAYGYLDPASGSMFLQVLLGGIAGVAVILKLYWHKLLDFLGVKKRAHDDDSS